MNIVCSIQLDRDSFSNGEIVWVASSSAEKAFIASTVHEVVELFISHHKEHNIEFKFDTSTRTYQA